MVGTTVLVSACLIANIPALSGVWVAATVTGVDKKTRTVRVELLESRLTLSISRREYLRKVPNK